MSEVYKVVKEFFSENENKVRCYDKHNESINYLIPFLKNINLHDKPDAYTVIGNSALIIEHFEFDSTYTTDRKGSKNRKELARINREFEKDIQNIDLKSGDTFCKHDTVNTDCTIDNYINNALKGLKKHYAKIDSYKQNLLDKSIINNQTDVKTMFWIEDTTFLGNTFKYKDNDNEPLILLHCDRFLDELSNCNKLDYIFCFSHHQNQKYIWFLDLNFISTYRENQIKISEIEINDFPIFANSFVTALN